MRMLTFNGILGYQDLLLRDFLLFFLAVFFSIPLTDPISGNAFDAKRKKRMVLNVYVYVLAMVKFVFP